MRINRYIILLIFSLNDVPSTNQDNGLSHNVEYYKTLHLNTETGQSSYGIASMAVNIEENEVVVMDAGEGYLLLSNFGVDEYYCEGTCTCDNNQRRSSGQTGFISRSLYFLLAAATPMFAVNKAREYFDEECKTVLAESGECTNPSSIRSEVGQCDPIMNEVEDADGNKKPVVTFGDKLVALEKEQEKKELQALEEEEKEEKKPKRMNTKKYKYMCQGNCQTDLSHSKNPVVMKDARDYQCEQLFLQEEIKIYTESDQTPFSRILIKTAELSFLENHLDEFCDKHPVWYSWKYIKIRKHYMEKPKFCDAGSIGTNKSIICVFLGTGFFKSSFGKIKDFFSKN